MLEEHEWKLMTFKKKFALKMSKWREPHVMYTLRTKHVLYAMTCNIVYVVCETPVEAPSGLSWNKTSGLVLTLEPFLKHGIVGKSNRSLQLIDS